MVLFQQTSVVNNFKKILKWPSKGIQLMVQLNLMSRLKDISMTQHLIKMKKDKAVHRFD